MKTKKKNIKIIEADLSRENVWGYAYKNRNLIEIEKTLKGKMRLLTLIHELVHHSFRNASERQVLKAERIIGDALWKEGYRKTDSSLR